MKSKIELDTVIIEDDLLLVNGSSTTFVNQSRLVKVDTFLLIEKIRLVGKMAKERGIKLLRKNSTFSIVNEHSVNYDSQFEIQDKLFDDLKQLVSEKVNKGIFSPTCDDPKLTKISDIQNKIRSMNNRQTSFSIINSIEYRVNEMIDALETNKNLTSIGF